MFSGKYAQAYQVQAVIREYTEARKRGQTELARNIRTANPDLTSRFDEVDKVFPKKSTS